VFIELTDHLRCSADHGESFLVLLPSRMEGRVVLAGDLGCPLCGRTIAIVEGVAEFGGGAPTAPRTALGAEAAATFLGLGGPGGYLALVGGTGVLAPELERLLPGVRLVAINPPARLPPAYPASVLRSSRLPLKPACMRGVLLGPGLSPEWVADSARALLPGLRIVGEGDPPSLAELELLASAEGVWVARRRQPGGSARSTL